MYRTFNIQEKKGKIFFESKIFDAPKELCSQYLSCYLLNINVINLNSEKNASIYLTKFNKYFVKKSFKMKN